MGGFASHLNFMGALLRRAAFESANVAIIYASLHAAKLALYARCREMDSDIRASLRFGSSAPANQH